MGFSWQEYWSGLLWHPPGDLPDSGIETVSLVSSIGGQALYHQHYLESSGLVQFSPVAQSCPTLCDPLDCSMPGFPVHHQLPGAYSNSYPLSWWCYQTISSSVSPSPSFNLSQHQGLFKRATSLHQVAKVLEFQVQHQSFQ